MERQAEILRFIKSRGRASLGEVADHVGLTKQGALRHLDALERDRVLVHESVEAGRPGRPEHAYRLTEAAVERFPHQHRELAGELADFLPSDQLERFFRLRAARLEAEYAERLAGLDFDERVRELARLATEHGHMAEVVEQADGSLAIRHCNCPIQDVATRTGHPCQEEQRMYGRLLGTPVRRTSWAGDAEPVCTYEVRRGG
ncbi:MAG TPA: winged helix-turn-helix transcriptional regulator [Candidatus Acidoferrales bacterium]|nr:winged helix-turn-helix transcriptional regulator [Candidatus Acidoferrales bacterium]